MNFPLNEYNFNEQKYVKSVSERAKAKFTKAQSTINQKTKRESYFEEGFGESPNIAIVDEEYKDVRKRIIPEPYLIHQSKNSPYAIFEDRDGKITRLEFDTNVITKAIYDEVDSHNIVKVEIGEGIEELEDSLFREQPLKEIILPNSLKKIGGGCFYQCRLKSITLPEKIEKIGTTLFADNVTMTSIKYSPITEIGIMAFYNTGISEPLIPYETITKIGWACFMNSNIKSFITPINVTKIERQTCANCKNLSFVRISENVTSIDESAFANTTKLSEIELLNTQTMTIAYDIFMGTSKNGTVKMRKDVDNSNILALLGSGWAVEYID